MALKKLIFEILCIALVDSYILGNSDSAKIETSDFNRTSGDFGVNNTIIYEEDEYNASEAFNGVYAECFLYLSYSCIQRKTLLYLQKLNDLREIAVLGEYLKFVKLNTTQDKDEIADEGDGSVELSSRIERAVDKFFDNHVLRFKALGKDIIVPKAVDEFVGRKKRKGGGGGGGGGGGHHGDDGGDGGKKKMMMMAMMCMKMKFMMMVPAMMGMMGMMSFKGMMFSMMSFMISKMMLLMKILEKKGGMGGGGGGDPGWAAGGGGGGGGGAWMPAGGSPDYGGGGGGGYDANGQWQSRSIPQSQDNTPEISYAKPNVRYNQVSLNDPNNEDNREIKSRKKRGLFDVIQNAYLYWLNRMLGVRRYNKVNQKYRFVNGVKYVYYPLRYVKVKPPKVTTDANETQDLKISVQDFNKGEIVDSPDEISSRTNKKKFDKMMETVDATVDDNPWE